MRTIADCIAAPVAFGDTTETTLGTLTLPQGAKKITGLWCYGVGGAGNTTLENLSGRVRYQSPDRNIAPQSLPLDALALTGTGMANMTPRIVPVDLDVQGNNKIECLVTLDLAQTIANTGRWGYIGIAD